MGCTRTHITTKAEDTMPQNLEGKITIVTGAASGMGLGTAEAFVAEGAKVMLADIDADRGQAAADRLGENAAFLRVDVRKDEDIEALVAATVDRWGALDAMFNNAGAVGEPGGILESTPQGFLDTINLLAGSCVSGHRHAARQFIAQGTGGSIMTTSSVGALQGGFSPIAYVAAKSAILGIVKQAAFELGHHGIRSNAIVPGAIATPIIAAAFNVPAEQGAEFTDFIADRLKDEQPIGRIGRPEDIAGAAVYLASDMSRFVTGTWQVVDGGATAVTLGRTTEISIAAAAEFAETHR
jgi:NAD(P)-dependent dehydrogenase (short-subunit alcohol dehydrogenase family)